MEFKSEHLQDSDHYLVNLVEQLIQDGLPGLDCKAQSRADKVPDSRHKCMSAPVFNVYYMGIKYLNTCNIGLRDVTGNGISIEIMSKYIKLFLLKYPSKKVLKENTLPNSIVLYFSSIKSLFPEKLHS
jgi:hypothetical protein